MLNIKIVVKPCRTIHGENFGEKDKINGLEGEITGNAELLI